MKRTITLLLIIFWMSPITGMSPFSSEIDSLILRGLDQTLCCQFDSAENTYQQITDRHPGHPLGYFYQAANLQSKMMDYETDLWEDLFYDYTEKAISLSIQRIDGGDEDPWTYFYLGSAYSYQGFFKAKTGSLLSGFVSASRGIRTFKKVMELDSTLYDTYLGLGNYKYWSGRFYKYLQWLPWIHDEREEGIRMIQISVNQGAFSHWVGLNSLGWIEFDRNNFPAALAIFQRGLEKYPESRFFLWGLADTYFEMEDYSNAIPLYSQLLTSIQAAKLNNGYNETECQIKLAESYYMIEQYETALHLCIQILEKKLDKKIARRLKKQVKMAEEYRKNSAVALGRVKVIRE